METVAKVTAETVINNVRKEEEEETANSYDGSSFETDR